MIHDDVLRARISRLGTITSGRGVEATSQAGNTYARPTRAKALVFHTDDEQVAQAVRARYGGTIFTDSPTWGFDIVTDARQVDVQILPASFRQALEAWRAAQCLRRCDGVTMSVLNGQPASRPCLCDEEIARGAERACSPHTVLASVVDLEVDRFGVWEIKATSWGTASNLKGTITALQLVGATGGMIPAVLAMVDRTVRDSEDKVHQVAEFQVTIARSVRSLELPDTSTAPALGPAEAPQRDRLALLEEWADVQARAHGLHLRDQLAERWRETIGPDRREIEDLDTAELAGWVDEAMALVEDTEAILRAEREETSGEGA